MRERLHDQRSGDQNRREFLCQLPVVALGTVSAARDVQASHIRQQEQTLSNGYISLSLEGERIISLRADATGLGHYGPETVAASGSIIGFVSARLNGRTLTLETRVGEFSWDLPFDRKGYYDADTHVNYPSPYSTEGAYPLILPFRQFVTSAGQVVLIESFKRLPLGVYFLNFVVAQGSQILFCSDKLQNYDLKVTWPGQSVVSYKIAQNRLTFSTKSTGKPVTIEVVPHGIEEVPGNVMIHPRVTFDPDPLIVYEPTGKSLPASLLMTDMMRFGIYWSPRVVVTGDWGLPAAEIYRINDPRSWHLHQLRTKLLAYMGFIGYDRFEHFGCMFAWSRFPDYGAGGLLNLPPSNAPYDMRTLHLNGQWIQTIADYVLATRDIALLRARRSRWLATDGKEPQPICGENSWVQDYVLAAGDMRLDGRVPKKTHTLGQTFTANATFGEVRVRLGTEGNEPASGVISLREGPGGKVLDHAPFNLGARKRDHIVTLSFAELRGPGKYFLEVSDDNSGRRYFGPGIFWWTDPETDYAGGEATSGPFCGTIHDRLKLLFEYIQNYRGAAKDHLAYYINDPEYNVPGYKSGCPGVCTENSYWEQPGGGYDAFEGLWYNSACNALAELAEMEHDDDSAAHYCELAEEANAAYNKKYWRTVNENGKRFSRYHACEDWDGKIHDYGFTYYNLEAAFRGIPSRQQVRSILWWLDRGCWSPDGGPILSFIQTWKDHIYSIWEIAPPFNTVGNTTWLNITRTLPYLEVIGNGGSRLFIAARDLTARSKYLSVDNMHERNKRILARFANPDRLTGGRTFDDPGGRGRWFFGKPFVNIADFEGFHEIFPQSGILPASEPLAYLGMDYAAVGLWLRPRVPSEIKTMKFEGIGYAGAVFDFQVEADRKEVSISSLRGENPLSSIFVALSRFNKVGVLAVVHPFKVRHDSQLTMVLEQRLSNGWKEVESTWYSHVQDDQWLWLTIESWLESEKTYRLTARDLKTPVGQTLEVKPGPEGGPLVGVQAEKYLLAVNCRYNPMGKKFTLRSESGEVFSSNPLQALMEPGQRVLLACTSE